MSSSDVVSAAGQTVLRDTKDCHEGRGGHHYNHDFGHRRDRCDDDNGDFHILSGQQRESIQIGAEGRSNAADAARLLKAVADVGERGADRSGAASLALLKALSDNEGRLAAAFALSNKSREDDTKALLREVCDTKVDLLKAALENRLECKENALRVVEKMNTAADTIRHDICKLGDKVDAFERRRLEDRIQTLETRLRCDHREGRGNSHGE